MEIESAFELPENYPKRTLTSPTIQVDANTFDCRELVAFAADPDRLEPFQREAATLPFVRLSAADLVRFHSSLDNSVVWSRGVSIA